MLTYNERILLKDKLKSGEIEVEKALEEYWKDYKEGQKSWHTNDWKERRLKTIKDKCEICGSKETLTLQHKSHPKKYSDYLREVTGEHTKQHINNNPIINKHEFRNYIINNYDYVPVPLCPSCNSTNPNKRVRKLPQYLCTSCKQEFDTPNYKSLDTIISIYFTDEDSIEVRDKCFISKDKWRNKHNLSNIKYWMQREFAKNKDSETITKEAFLLYLNDDIKYLSFEDTITACKKCSSSYDLYNMELCPQCKMNYKSIQYPTCIQCLPEDKKKAALESIEFAKEWQGMHKKLGLD